MRRVQVIWALGCRPCERVKARLEELRARHPDLEVEEVDLLTDEGVRLAARHRVFSLPTLILDDTVVGEGDVELPELERALGLVADRGV
jgi:thiol-disulfide isomerase/thioredoxin